MVKHNMLPLQGFYGVSDQTAITIGDVFHLHFMKNTKVMIAETAEKVQLSIPVNSSLMVGIMYDPNNNVEEARRGLKVGKEGEKV